MGKHGVVLAFNFVKTSTEAYIGCLAGAIMKDSYIEEIGSAGFQNIRIADESSFPVECLIFDTVEPPFIDMPKTSPRQLKEVEESISSIKVVALKPS